MNMEKILKFSLLFLLYLSTARLGLYFDAIGGFASLIWPPSGIAFAFLLIFGPRLAPAVTLAAFIANYTSGAPLLTALAISIGNTLEPLIGTYLFRLHNNTSGTLRRVSEVLRFVLIAAFSSSISATIGTIGLRIAGIIDSINLAWPAWWLGDVISILIISPFILIWRRPTKLPKLRVKKIEAFVLSALVFLITIKVFTQSGFIYWRPYWCHLLLIWATLRFTQHATTLFMITIAFIAVWATAEGLGPFQLSSLSMSLLALQLFLASLALTGLFFSALNCERERALDARSDFVSIASHELKTPLTVLDIQMQVLKQNELPPAARTALKNMDFHLQRLNKLVSSLLDISKIESGKFPIQKEEVSLTEIIQGVAENFQEYLKREKCALTLDLENQIKAKGDQYRLEQVITNLLINSIKYGAGKPIKISLNNGEDFAHISVEDQGPGIAPENLERIFERFERVTSSKNTQGLGLGLYIAREIVLAHEGRIWVESEFGKGSIFHIELPT